MCSGDGLHAKSAGHMRIGLYHYAGRAPIRETLLALRAYGKPSEL